MLSIKELKRRIELDNAFTNKHRQKNGWYCGDKELELQRVKQLGFKVNNAQRSRVEIYDFKNHKDKTYFAYMKKSETTGIYRITNFTGDTISFHAWVKSKQKLYNSVLSNERIYFDCVGINGIKYYGIGYGNGIYCRLYAHKNQ